MPVYPGSCHCGDVRYEIRKETPIELLMDCNCSICQKKGLIHTPVENDELAILKGGGSLRLYQFGSRTAKYWFCPTCGVEPFHRSRTNPQRYSVNARTLDDFDALLARCGLRFIDARDHPLDRGETGFPERPNPYHTDTRVQPKLIGSPEPQS